MNLISRIKSQIRQFSGTKEAWLDYCFFQKLMLSHPSDKWTSHSFGPHYFRHFLPRRLKTTKILEIGVGGYMDQTRGYSEPTAGGHSLRFWKAFFPNAQVFAIDIEDKSPLAESRIRILQGSQTDVTFLEKVVEESGGFDIIIDDGSHVNSHVIETFKFLFPALAEDGLYVVEDTQTSYWPEGYGGNIYDLNTDETMMGFFKSLVDGLNHVEFLRPGYEPTYFDKHILAMAFYHNLVFIEKGDNSEPSNMVVDHKLA